MPGDVSSFTFPWMLPASQVAINVVAPGIGVYDTADLLDNVVGPANGVVVCLRGINSANDGLGGFYAWDSSSTATADGQSVIAATGTTTGRWLRLPSNAGSITATRLTLASAISAGASSATVNEALVGLIAAGGQKYIAINPYTTSCDVVAVSHATGSSLTFNTATSAVRNTHAVGSQILVMEDNEVTPQMFGAVADGITDDAPAINAALAATGRVLLPPGCTYAIESPITVNDGTAYTRNRGFEIRGGRGTIYSADPRTIIKAMPSFDSTKAMIVVGEDADTSGGVPMMGLLENIYLDGNNNTALAGIRYVKGISITTRRVSVEGCRHAGFWLDSTYACSAIAQSAVTNILHDTCWSWNNGSLAGDAGYLVDCPAGGVIGAFDQFLFLNCQSGLDDYVGWRISNTPGVKLDTCVIQPSGVGIEVVGSDVSVDSSFVESVTHATSMTVQSGVGPSFVHIRQSVVDAPVVDNDCFVVSDVSYVGGRGFSIGRQVLGRLYDDTSSNGYGPPPMSGKTGDSSAVWSKGAIWVDAYGNEWICTTAGTGYASRWRERHGRITMPFTYLDITNGNTLWWSQEDAVLVNVALQITSAFTGTDATQAVALSTSNVDQDNLIDEAQLTFANLGTLHFIATSAQNATGTPLLTGGKRKRIAGGAGNASPGNNNVVFCFVNHNPPAFTAGAGLLIIDLHYPKFGL